MSERNGARFEGMVLAKLSALDERMEETLEQVRAIQERGAADQAAHASLLAELRAIREKVNFNSRVIWSAVAWIVMTALGTLIAVLGGR